MTSQLPDRRIAIPTRWLPRQIPPGHEWWEGPTHHLTYRAGTAQRRGLIRRTGLRVELYPGWHGELVERLRPDPPAWHRHAAYAAAVAAVVVMALALVLLAWSARYAIAAVLAAVLLAPTLRALTGHQPTCTGLHCGGCRG